MKVALGLILLTSLNDPAVAGLIELSGRQTFTDVESSMVTLANQGFASELQALDYRVLLERAKPDSKGPRTQFKGNRITIQLKSNIQDPLEFAAVMCHELGHVLSNSALISPE